MQRVRITGGPSPLTVRVCLINDDGTEQDISSRVRSVEFGCRAGAENLMTAKLEMFVETDATAEIKE